VVTPKGPRNKGGLFGVYNALKGGGDAMQPVIVAEGLTRRFGAQVALNRLDLTVSQGEVFGFLGPNGAGKTTTVRLLNGVLDISDGHAQVLGLEVGRQPAEVRRQTGVLTESPSLYDALTARENLRFFGDLYGVPEAQLAGRIEYTLEEMGLTERGDDRVGAYSKGMRQRLAIARALLHEPALLFLDEPTSGLDPAAARMVTTLIRKLSHQQGRTIFLCTHNLAEAQRLCDRVGVIDRGTLRAIGTPQELARQLWQGLWIEIDLRGQPDPAILQALGHIAAVRQQKMEEDLLLLELDAETAIPDVVAAIVGAGGRVHRVLPREHTLEDIYFEIQGNHQGQPNGGNQA
jgi:ABC-2 type transport system ATP-binding protein